MSSWKVKELGLDKDGWMQYEAAKPSFDSNTVLDWLIIGTIVFVRDVLAVMTVLSSEPVSLMPSPLVPYPLNGAG